MFESITGHKTPCEVLTRMVAHGTLPHALLFVGPSHVGKTAVAMELIRQLLGDVSLESSPNVIHIKRLVDEKTGKTKQKISVKQIRALKERMSMSAMGTAKKIVFIEEADRMGVAASNALLKTLEEPRGDTLIILRASHVSQLLPTIVSRCQVLSFSLVDDESLPALAGGRPGIAKRMEEDVLFRDELEERHADVRECISASVPERLGTIAGWFPKSEPNKAQVAEELLDATEIELHRAGHVHGLDRLVRVRQAIQQNTNPQLALEHLFLHL